MASYENSSVNTTARDENGEASRYSGAPTTEVFAAARSATRIDDGAGDLFPDVHAAAAPTMNGAPYIISSGARAATQNKNGKAVDKAAAYYYNSGVVAGEARPLASKVFGGKTTSVPAVAVGHDKVAGAFPERLRRELPVLGLSLVSKVFGGKTTSVPAVAVGQDKVAGAFTERLRRGLPLLGLSVASLAVTGLAAGDPTPAAGFGLFLMLIVGLSTVTIRALRD